ncbi:hypothetical protein EDB89DRAFT_348934 [Lactarius sanguifluus]|nr:hypothetical protein EDB89DRAFT_348934 [Lactarius sanguifluus]
MQQSESQPRVPIPLTWLESTFNTHSRTEQLLRPELDNGVITQHDFDAAVNFFPSTQRYYSIAGGILGTFSIVLYGQLLRRPPLPFHRIASLAAFASAGGVLGGTVVRANAHADFFRTLDDRTSFFQAIDNIQTRLGEKSSSDSHTSEKEMFGDAATSRGWESEFPVDKSTDRSPASRSSAPPAQPSQPKSRWEEIRAEHARNLATRSSWDELRQNASRPKSDNAGNEQIEVSQDPASERLTEQQKFDAMLQAERRKTAERSQGSPWST